MTPMLPNLTLNAGYRLIDTALIGTLYEAQPAEVMGATS